jgi:hypothetical protein
MQNASTLKELLAEGVHDGFRLAVAHYAELEHGLMGFFPAIESESGKMVMTLDPELLKQVCATLTARRFKFGTQLVYVNLKTGVAYSIHDTDKKALEESTPFQIFTKARFDELDKKKQPFKWAPGLVGAGMTAEEFEDALKSALTDAS